MKRELRRRDALKLLGAGGAGLLLGGSELSAKTNLSMPATHKRARIVVAGGGTAGMSAAARMRRAAPNAQIILIAPNETHLYQPGQVFVAAGLYLQRYNEWDTADLVPDRVTWLKERVVSFDPERNRLETEKSGKVVYDILVVALGAAYDYERIEGLHPSMIGKYGIASVYLNDTIQGRAYGGDLTHMVFREIERSARKTKKPLQLLCTEPDTPIKGVGVTFDLLFLGSDYLRKRGLSKNTAFTYAKADDTLFPSAPFARRLQKELAHHPEIRLQKGHILRAIDASKKIATFDKGGEKMEMPYDFIHITPPMRAPEVMRRSPLAITKGVQKGWMDVDTATLQHRKYPNVFGIGDVIGNTPGKSGGAAQHQAVVMQDNIVAALEEKPLPYRYDGYTVAPIMTEYGKIMMAEYNAKKPLPTLPLDPTEPRRLWWLVDRYLMRWIYFHLVTHGMM